MMKRVPLPGVLSTSILPLCALTIQATKLSPSPRPCSGRGRGALAGDAIEAVEDVRQVLGGNAAAVILHDQFDERRAAPAATS